MDFNRKLNYPLVQHCITTTMEYKEIKPCKELDSYIHSFWELNGDSNDNQWQRNFPDGCAGLVLNLGDTCLTDNGSVVMDFGKTYAVGAMTSFKDSFIDSSTHLLGICLKPASFSTFYNYAPQNELTNNTIEFDKSLSFNIDQTLKNPTNYFNEFFTNRIRYKSNLLQSILEDIQKYRGQLSIHELAKRNFTTVRQLERNFKTHIGISPKEYSNIIRFQNTLTVIKNADENRSLLDIAFECGFYDHSHLTNEIKRNTGLTPTQINLSHFSKVLLSV
jgi:AraC-like DNA-binding protein